MPKPKSVTIFDVAQASGVSYSTVSRVLNNFEHVKPETRQRVLQAAERLGYVANLPARSLAGGKSQIIGMIVPRFDSGYVSCITQGIDEALAKEGYDLMVYTTHYKQDKEARYVHMMWGLSDGLLLMTPVTPAQQTQSSYLDILRDTLFPYVLIDQTEASGQSTVVDSTNWQGAYEATAYLCRLGHRQIGFITGLMDIHASQERLKGYQAALRDHHIAENPTLIAEGDFYYEKAYQAAQQLLTLDARPTAIFASNDLSAFGVMDAARAQGLRLPTDLSVIGFDDIPQASMVHPTLTTVRQPLNHMGTLAAGLLLEQLKDTAKPPQHITLATALIKRDSCHSVPEF